MHRLFIDAFIAIAFVYRPFGHATIQRNVLLIMCDDLRPALGAYGDPKARTPNIDRLAAQSFVFKRAYAQQSLCAPSRNSMLTSRRPDSLRLYDFYSYWRQQPGVPNFSTLPQLFKSAGYHTRSFGKVFHPGASSNWTDDYPFSWSLPAFHSPAEQFMNLPLCEDSDDTSDRLQRNVICPVDVARQPMQTLPDIETVREAKRFLLLPRLDRPYFAAVGLHKPHIPLRFPRHYLDQQAPLAAFRTPPFAYVPYDLPAVAFNPYTDIRAREDARQEDIPFPFGPIPEHFGLRLRRAYYAAVSYVDGLIGELLEGVDVRDTVVVLCSDHGWSLGEHAEWAKYSNYEVAVRVPLLIRTEHLRPKGLTVVDRIVELLDVFPTIVELAGDKVPRWPRCQKNTTDELRCTDGKSLVPFMLEATEATANDQSANEESTADADDTDVAFSQYPRPAAYPQWNSDRPRAAHIRFMGYSMRTPRFRYTAWVAFDAATAKRDWSARAGEELYDHRLDGAEDCNLAGRAELAGVLEQLRRRLRMKFP